MGGAPEAIHLSLAGQWDYGKIPAGAGDLEGDHSSPLCDTKGLNKLRSVYRDPGLKLDHRRDP